MTSEPVLALPDYSKPYKIRTNASDYAIGGVLIQEDPNRGKSKRAPMGVKVSYDREVKNIEADRVVR